MKGKYRYEQKYIIKKAQYLELRQILAAMMEQDDHVGDSGDYMIRSLYFDDMYRSAYKEKLDGVYVRKKYRVRVYNCEDRVIHLECKHKQGAYIFKESAPLTREEYDNILKGELGFLLKRKEPVAREFFVDARGSLIHPEVIVDYEREPYVYDAGTVRITFDKEVRAGSPEDSLFDSQIPTYGVLRPDEMILEIKFTGYLPERIRRLFYVENYTQTSASKYCLCVDKIREFRYSGI